MTHERYMHRALQLARRGFPHAMPNPMVGAVIVDDTGRIIGEGYHRRCGEGHAEVNAIASVRDRDALARSTIYVTLEPCAHYGRTGPCAQLIIDTGIPRVVVGCRDPFEKVDGRGIDMLRQAGVEVTVGVLEHECRSLNAVFFTAHTLHRPFIMLKWAQTADGWIDSDRADSDTALRISTGLTSTMVHAWRAMADAILVGSGTALADRPSLTTRLWPGTSPRPIVLDRRGRIDASATPNMTDPIVISEDKPLSEIMADLYTRGITSVMVEGGATVLQAFIDAGLWDLARVETSPVSIGEHGTVMAPLLLTDGPVKTVSYSKNRVDFYSKNGLIDVKNL